MKAIAFNREPGAEFVRPAAVSLIADSAIVIPGRPVFLPDFASEWKARIFPAFRMSRLGKGVGEKFAHRYYESVTLALKFEPKDAESTLAMSGSPMGLSGLFDSALMLGTWEPVSADGCYSIGSGELKVEADATAMGIDSAVAIVSSYATIKIGDIIMPWSVPMEGEVKVGDHIVASLNGKVCLDVKIK